MTDVLVERQWQPPLTDADVQRLLQASDGCLGIHRVQWRGSLLSADGTQLLCRFQAADAESVRIALRRACEPTGSVWACSVHDAPGGGPAAVADHVSTHAFDEPVEPARVDALLRSPDVPLLQACVSNDRRRIVCLHRAADAGIVERALQRLGLAPQRVFAARHYTP